MRGVYWLGIVSVLGGVSSCRTPGPYVRPADFETTHAGKPVRLFTLHNSHGLTVQLTNYGGKIVSIWVPDRDGRPGDICLGYETAEAYIHGTASLGATMGRYANRIANGRFTLNGRTCDLPKNNGAHTIHGGTRGFRFLVWDGEQVDAATVRLSLTSPDGDQGFPGTLRLEVTYTLTEDDALRLDYRATTDQATVINFTNHAFFNLRGEGRGDVLDHVLWVNARQFTPTDATAIPTGEIRNVAGTPFDFTVPKPLGRDIEADNEQLRFAGGYDHNFVLNGTPGILRPAARLSEPVTGRVMEVLTTEPGLQVYTANSLTGQGTDIGKGGKAYGPRSAVCLETQHFPDSPNHPEFPSTVLNPGETYRSTTLYRFSTE